MISFLIYIFTANIGPRSGPGSGKKASYGSGKQTLRLKSNGTAAIEEVDNVRTLAEENIIDAAADAALFGYQTWLDMSGFPACQ